MIYNSHDNYHLNRRILTFPVIRPCDCVSFNTLITSLISLTSKIITFSGSHFTSNKNNAITTIRFIQALHVSLLEIQNLGIFHVAPLIDLHVELQRVNFLLNDCTRRDASVWMLVNAALVARQFVAVVRAVVGVLEGFGLDGGEERAYVLFLIKRGKKVKFEVEKDDIWALNLIKFVLGQFSDRVIPDPIDLKRVMDYLGVKTWSECDKQVKFLEELNGSGFGFGLDIGVSGLMSYMVYCRSVLFHCIDDGYGREKGKEDNGWDMGSLNPDDFRCPISLEIMSDPVTISSGQTYDRVSIVKWFKSGNPVCPKTGEVLDSLDMVPNLVLRKLIKEYCLQNGIALQVAKCEGKEKGLIQKGSESCLVAKEATRMVADYLSIKVAMVSTMEEKAKVAFEIRLLAKRSEFNRVCFVESGAIPSLLNLLLSNDSSVQENAIAALLNLAKNDLGKAMVVDNGGIVLVCRVLKSGSRIMARQYAAAALFYLSSVEEYRGLIGSNRDAIPSLVELIRMGDDRGKRNAMVAILGLLKLRSNHSRVLKAGVVPLLLSLLGGLENEELVDDALAVLSALSKKPDGAKAISRARDVNVLVGIMCSFSYDSSRSGREHCVSLLLALCINCGREVVEVLVKSTSLMGALYSLITDGTSTASKKARSLISILLEFGETRSAQSMPLVLPHESFIHVR